VHKTSKEFNMAILLIMLFEVTETIQARVQGTFDASSENRGCGPHRGRRPMPTSHPDCYAVPTSSLHTLGNNLDTTHSTVIDKLPGVEQGDPAHPATSQAEALIGSVPKGPAFRSLAPKHGTSRHATVPRERLPVFFSYPPCFPGYPSPSRPQDSRINASGTVAATTAFTAMKNVYQGPRRSTPLDRLPLAR
jgi:hypothetical protein